MLFNSFSLRDMMLAPLFAALTGLGALMVIPVYPVPFTLQTLFTYLSAMLLGRKIGTLSQVIYILLGVIGLPIFSAGKAGLGILLGPTGGYLWGFIISAYTMGILVEKKNINKIKGFIVVGIIGLFIINFCGALQLYIVTQLSLKAVLLTGVIPFIIGDFIKIVTASFIAHKLKLTLTLNRMI